MVNTTKVIGFFQIDHLYHINTKIYIGIGRNIIEGDLYVLIIIFYYRSKTM